MAADKRKTPGQYLILSLIALPFLVFAGFLAYFGVRGTPMSALVHSGIYSEAMTRARTDPRVHEVLGSPIETDKGWLVLTHGVGPVRKYSMGAFLLDLDNPARVIGRLREPLLAPNENEREGYVPNVVYSCGGVVHSGHLIIPYAMSDYASTFATVPVDQLLEQMTSS